MSVLDALTGSSAEDYDPVDTIEFSTEGEMIVTLALDETDANAIEVLDSEGELVQARMLLPAQWVATIPLRENQPVTRELVGGGRSTYRVPRSERDRLDLPEGDPLPPGEYQIAVGQTEGPTARRDIMIPAEATLTD